MTNQASSPGEAAEYAILVVDDNEDLLSSAEMLLSISGYKVHACSCPHVALQILRDQADINVLLTDVVMPRMNGFELADSAKQIRPELCVIYMTGYSADLLPQPGGLHGKLLSKPWSLDVLVEHIEQC